MLDAETRNQFRRQGQMPANRVRKRFRHLKKRFDRQNIEVFRLYDWDIPENRAVVDWYAGICWSESTCGANRCRSGCR